MCIRFGRIDGFIRVCGGEFRNLVLFDYEPFDEIYDRIKYRISGKSDITSSTNHNFGEIRIDSYNSSTIEKTLTFHDVIILIKSFANKNENNYYYNIF